LKNVIHFENIIAQKGEEILKLEKDNRLPDKVKKEKIENARESMNLAVEQKAFFSNELFTKYDSKISGPIEEKYRAQLELEEKKKLQRPEAERLAKENTKNYKDALADIPRRIKFWSDSYDDAVKKNNAEDIKKKAESLDYNINLMKSQNPELYRTVQNGEETVYISLPLTDAKHTEQLRNRINNSKTVLKNTRRLRKNTGRNRLQNRTGVNMNYTSSNRLYRVPGRTLIYRMFRLMTESIVTRFITAIRSRMIMPIW